MTGCQSVMGRDVSAPLWRLLVSALLAVAVLNVGCVPAIANWLSELEHAAESGAENTGVRAVEKAMRQAAELARGIKKGLPRATLKPSLDGSFRLTDEANRVIFSFRPGEKIVLATGFATWQIVVPEALLAHSQGIVRSLLEQADLHVAVAGSDGIWPLRLERVGERTAIVIDASPTLSLTPEAFARRGALEARAAASLVERMRVIPLIPAEDVVGVGQFRDQVARLAGIPDSRDAALRMLAESDRNLIVVTGHVEDDAFVVRPAVGPAFTVPFADIQRAADGTQSEVLMLGCRVACAAPYSGPVKDIYQADVIGVLSDLDTKGTALALLQRLSEKVGPLLIQEDHGGFRVIEAAFAQGQNSAAVRSGAFVARLALHGMAPEGRSWLAALSGFGAWDFVALICRTILIGSLLGWIATLLLGVGPVRAWRLIREDRAERLGLDDTLAPIRGRSLALYAVFGPWVVIGNAMINLGALFLSMGMLLASPVGGIVAWTVAIGVTADLRRRWPSLQFGASTPGRTRRLDADGPTAAADDLHRRSARRRLGLGVLAECARAE